MVDEGPEGCGGAAGPVHQSTGLQDAVHKGSCTQVTLSYKPDPDTDVYLPFKLRKGGF